MSSACSPSLVYGLQAMSDSTRTPTTLSNIGVAMFAVADQDATLAFYTERLIHKSNLMTVTTPSPSDVSVIL